MAFKRIMKVSEGLYTKATFVECKNLSVVGVTTLSRYNVLNEL